MKYFLMALLIAGNAMATQSFRLITSGSSAIPSTYGSSGGSSWNIVRDENYGRIDNHGFFSVCVMNEASTGVALATAPYSVRDSAVDQTPSNVGLNLYVPANTSRCKDMNLSGALYIRSITGNFITSGTVSGDIDPAK